MISLLNTVLCQKNKQKMFGSGHNFAFQHQKLTRPKLLNEIANHIIQRRSVVVLYFDLVKFTEIEQNCGDVLSKKILDQFKKTLHSEMPRLLWNLRILAVENLWGDDYIIITGNSCVEIICNKVIRYFDRLIKTYYDPCDRKNGFVPGHDRNCQECEYPIVSISLAVVSGSNRKKTNMRTISEKAAQLKSYAKSIPGSNFVRDRRIESSLVPPLTEITNRNNSELITP